MLNMMMNSSIFYSGIETPDLALRPDGGNSSSPTNDFQAPLIQSADGSLGLDVSNQEAMSTSSPEELEDVDPIQQAVAVTLTGTIGLPTIPMSPVSLDSTQHICHKSMFAPNLLAIAFIKISLDFRMSQ